MNFLKVFYFLLISVIIVVFIFSYKNKDFPYNYEHTRAICEKNVCRDYLIKCKNNEVMNVAPISGFVTFSEDWKDRRPNRELCDLN